MPPAVRAVHERYDVFKEQLSTTVSGEAWDGGPTFEMTDCGGALTGGIDGLRLGGATAALRASRVAPSGALSSSCTLRAGGSKSSLTLASPVKKFAPTLTARGPLPGDVGFATAWASHSGATGGAVELGWRGPSASAGVTVDAVRSARGGAPAATATLRCEADVAALPRTRLGAEYRLAEPDALRLRCTHTRPPGTPAAGFYVTLQAHLQRGVRFERKDATILLGRSFDVTPPPPACADS